jgi:hypothetical protein
MDPSPRTGIALGHLQGKFLAKGNFGLCKEMCKEIKLRRKWQGILLLGRK